MEINRKKLIYAILREVNNNSSIKYTYDSFSVDEVTFIQCVQIIIEENYAKGFTINYYDNKPNLIVGTPRITMSGINFLEDNHEWVKLYKGLKEIKAWIPFIY